MAFTDILPSRQFIWTVLSLAIAAALISLAADAGREAAREAGVKTASQKTITQETDTDKDGLKDWEEALWGTNPREADTDGDGTKDGAEVDASRDPTKPGPDDELREAPDSIAAADGDEASTLTRTDVFSRKLFSAFLSAQQTGALNQETQQEFVAGFLRENFDVSPEKNPYAESDFFPVATTKKTLRAYGNTLGSITNTYASQTRTNEIFITRQALRENNPAQLQELSVIINLYEAAARDLAQVNPPDELLGEHVAITNAITHVATSLKKVQNVFEDPVGSVEAIEQYRNRAKSISTNVQQIQFVFAKEGITFSQNEPGSVFFR